MPKAQADGLRIHWRSFGNGPAEALLLHCGLGQSGMWKAVAEQLAPACRMTAPDLPGHGRSAPFPPDKDVHDVAFTAMQPFVGPASRVHLVGHSFGATVALRLALCDPGRVASLTLIEPVFFAAARAGANFASHRAAEETFFRVYATGDRLAAAECFNRLWGGGVPWDSFPPRVQATMAEGMPFVVGTEPSLWQDCHGMLAPGGLEGLDCPVALVRGSQTVPVIADVHAGLLQRLPNARETVIPDAGHMLVITHAVPVAQAVGACMAQADPATG